MLINFLFAVALSQVPFFYADGSKPSVGRGRGRAASAGAPGAPPGSVATCAPATPSVPAEVSRATGDCPVPRASCAPGTPSEVSSAYQTPCPGIRVVVDGLPFKVDWEAAAAEGWSKADLEG